MIVKVHVEAFVKTRIKKGFSQRGLGKASGLSGAFISQIESNDRGLSPQSAKKLCEALGVEFDDIFFAESVSFSKQLA